MAKRQVTDKCVENETEKSRPLLDEVKRPNRPMRYLYSQIKDKIDKNQLILYVPNLFLDNIVNAY